MTTSNPHEEANEQVTRRSRSEIAAQEVSNNIPSTNPDRTPTNPDPIPTRSPTNPAPIPTRSPTNPDLIPTNPNDIIFENEDLKLYVERGISFCLNLV